MSQQIVAKLSPILPHKEHNPAPLSPHTDLDVLCCLEAIELVEQLQHGALHLAIAATTAAVCSRGADRIDLVHEDDGRRVLSVLAECSANVLFGSGFVKGTRANAGRAYCLLRFRQ